MEAARHTEPNAREIAQELQGHELEAMAALHNAPPGVAAIAATGWGRGTRNWALAYGLVREDRSGELSITPLGHDVIRAASELCPRPFEDVTLSDVAKETESLINEAAQGAPSEVERPSAAPVASQHEAARVAAADVLDRVAAALETARDRLRGSRDKVH